MNIGKLSPRERELIAVVVTFRKTTEKELAAHMGIQEKTVQTYEHRIYEKCGTHSLLETVLQLCSVTVNL